MRTAIAVAVITMLLAPAASAQTAPFPAPPNAFLASSSGEVEAEIQFYCWTEPDGNGMNIGICADNFDPIDPPRELSVREGELLTLRFDRPIRPDSIRVSRRGNSLSAPLQTIDVPAENPTQFRADFPPGTHIVTVSTQWPQGDAYYVFELTVRPAPPQLGVLSPEVLDAIARLTEAAGQVGTGEGPIDQRIMAVLASTAALTAALRDQVDLLLGAR